MIIEGDSLEYMKQMEDESVDLVITDPLYNIDYHSNMGSREYQAKNRQEWDKNFDFKPFYHEIMRVLKNNSVAYVFSRFDTYAKYMKQGLPIPYSVLVWDKGSPGIGNLSWWGNFEIILCWTKGKPKLNYEKRPQGIIRCFNVQAMTISNKMHHPTEKPVGIIKPLILNTSKEDELILDPFGGSGTTAVACIITGRNCVVIEKEKKYVDIIKKRVKETKEKYCI